MLTNLSVDNLLLKARFHLKKEEYPEVVEGLIILNMSPILALKYLDIGSVFNILLNNSNDLLSGNLTLIQKTVSQLRE
mgnify:CR=1 FL=1